MNKVTTDENLTSILPAGIGAVYIYPPGGEIYILGQVGGEVGIARVYAPISLKTGRPWCTSKSLEEATKGLVLFANTSEIYVKRTS